VCQWFSLVDSLVVGANRLPGAVHTGNAASPLALIVDADGTYLTGLLLDEVKGVAILVSGDSLTVFRSFHFRIPCLY
jgi:hypothetical protein